MKRPAQGRNSTKRIVKVRAGGELLKRSKRQAGSKRAGTGGGR